MGKILALILCLSLLLVFLGLILSLLILPIWATINCATSQRTNKSKILWIIFILLSGGIGALIYGIFYSQSKSLKIFSITFIVLAAIMATVFVYGLNFSSLALTKEIDQSISKIDTINTSALNVAEVATLKSSLTTLSHETNFDIHRTERMGITGDLFEYYLNITKNNRINREPYEDWQQMFNLRESFQESDLKQTIKEKEQKLPLYSVQMIQPSQSSGVQNRGLDKYFIYNAGDSVNVIINPPVDLNGKSRQDILDLRQESVQKFSDLAPSGYQPNMSVFGQIQDGKPWWGLLGESYYGPGDKSILGASKEARYILNPFLLIGVEEAGAHPETDTSLTPQEIYPRIKQLLWGKNEGYASVIYTMTDYYSQAVQYHWGDAQNILLTDINARDFGFNYLAIDSKNSQGIEASFDKLIPIIEMFHTGPSCGYPGGCNNKSPYQNDLQVKWDRLPAYIYVKLWKNSPATTDQQPDFSFIIKLV